MRELKEAGFGGSFHSSPSGYRLQNIWEMNGSLFIKHAVESSEKGDRYECLDL